MVARRQGTVRSSSRPPYVRTVVPCTSVREVGDQVLGEAHHVAVVGVGLVELQHRELGVPAGPDALVAEGAADLEDTLETTDHEALQVELRRDPEVEVEVEGVVMRDERTRQRAAGDGMEDRCLDLDEAALLQPAPREADDAAAREEDVARLGVRPQIDVTLPVAGLDIGDAVPLVAEAAAGLGQQIPRAHLHRQLAALGRHDLTGGADPVAERELVEGVELGGDRRQREQLDLRTAAVAQRCEGQLALRPVQHDAPGHRDGHAGLLAWCQLAVAGTQLRRAVSHLIPVRERRAHITDSSRG